MNRFLVFVRADRHPWSLHGEATSELSTAVRMADEAVKQVHVRRAVVMEVGGTDALPAFMYRYGAKS